jgi:hypothetical protein
MPASPFSPAVAAPPPAQGFLAAVALALRRALETRRARRLRSRRESAAMGSGTLRDLDPRLLRDIGAPQALIADAAHRNASSARLGAPHTAPFV